MNRREVLTAGAGTVVALAGGTVVVNGTRPDLLADNELARGEGEAVALERTITRDSVEYLESTDAVRENGHTRPFEEWARSECAEIGANEIVAVIENRLDRSVEGVGSGVRYLTFGPVVTVDHTVTRDRDGAVVSEPNVPLDRLTSVTPRTLTITVTLDAKVFTAELPGGVARTEVSAD